MIDERNFERCPLIYDFPVCNNATGQTIGFISDISPAGAMLKTDKPLQPSFQPPFQVDDVIYHLTINLENYATEAVSFDAFPVWQRQEACGQYNAGLQFFAPSLAVKSKVERFMLDFGC